MNFINKSYYFEDTRYKIRPIPYLWKFDFNKNICQKQIYLIQKKNMKQKTYFQIIADIIENNKNYIFREKSNFYYILENEELYIRKIKPFFIYVLKNYKQYINTNYYVESKKIKISSVFTMFPIIDVDNFIPIGKPSKKINTLWKYIIKSNFKDVIYVRDLKKKHIPYLKELQKNIEMKLNNNVYVYIYFSHQLEYSPEFVLYFEYIENWNTTYKNRYELDNILSLQDIIYLLENNLMKKTTFKYCVHSFSIPMITDNELEVFGNVILDSDKNFLLEKESKILSNKDKKLKYEIKVHSNLDKNFEIFEIGYWNLHKNKNNEYSYIFYNKNKKFNYDSTFFIDDKIHFIHNLLKKKRKFDFYILSIQESKLCLEDYKSNISKNKEIMKINIVKNLQLINTKIIEIQKLHHIYKKQKNKNNSSNFIFKLNQPFIFSTNQKNNKLGYFYHYLNSNVSFTKHKNENYEDVLHTSLNKKNKKIQFIAWHYSKNVNIKWNDYFNLFKIKKKNTNIYKMDNEIYEWFSNQIFEIYLFYKNIFKDKYIYIYCKFPSNVSVFYFYIEIFNDYHHYLLCEREPIETITTFDLYGILVNRFNNYFNHKKKYYFLKDL